MIERMLNYIMSNTRRAYGLFFITLMVGLIMMILTTSTHELDEIELSEPYEIVIFITFILGMFLSFLSVGFILNIYVTNFQHDRLMEEMKG